MSKKKSSGKKLAKVASKTVEVSSQRGYREVSGIGTYNKDWAFNMLGEDSDVWQNAWALTSRCRDLARTVPLFQKYRETSWANVFGDKGILLRCRIKETGDRVVYASDEKKALVAHEARINRLRDWAVKKTGLEIEKYRAFKLADQLERTAPEQWERGKATVISGQSDIYANMVLEAAWKEWGQAKYADVRCRRSYNTLRQLRLWNAIRDGDCFIVHVEDSRINRFGYSTRIIPAEWCDRFYNTILDNGNVVIMGIEYQNNSWGLGKPVAFYFIKRQPMDWQFSIPGAFNFASGNFHERVDADSIIHYARPVDADQTRPAPWIASCIPKARQLDQYELAEVIAAREAACKVGFLYSDVLPEGGIPSTIDPRTGLPQTSLSPGEIHALPYGVKYMERSPNHPEGNFPSYRESMIQSQAAGMAGGDYNVLANDLKNINFSAGRLGRLDTNETNKLLQQFDIETAETPVFERWLFMALTVGVVPLPLAKFEKFNSKVFQGRRWRDVDEVKEVNAAALRIANKLNSRNRECADYGDDWEEIVTELAEEEMILEQFGMSTTTTAEGAKPAEPATDVADSEDDPAAPTPPKKPAKKAHSQNGNGNSELTFNRIKD